MPMSNQCRKLSTSEDGGNSGKSEIQPLIYANNNRRIISQNTKSTRKLKKSLSRRCVKAVLNYVAHKDANEKDIVQRFAGVLGRWQLWICFAIFLVKFPIAWHQLNHVLVAPTTTFWCKNNATDQCAADCEEHEYDRSIFTETIITQWDLVCDRRYLANLSQTIVMLGILVGNMLFGWLSDRWGRRYPLVGAVILQAVTGTAAAVVPWFWAYLVFRFLSTVATGGTMVTSFVLIMELVGTKWRTAVGTLYQIPFNLGHCTLPVIAYFLRDWRYLQLAISLPSVLLICYCWVVPESPRWLLTTGKAKKATRVLEWAARVNKLPTDKIAAAVEDHINAKGGNMDDEKPKSGGNMLDLVRTNSMRMKTIAICFNWLVCGLCFFGVAQFMGQLGGNIFVNVFVSAIIQVPGTFISIITMEKLGRRCTLMTANTIAGMSMLLVCVVPHDPTWIKTMLGTLGMFGLSICFPTVYIFSGELFPTTIRNVGVGASSMSARIGSMAAPFVATLNVVQLWLPPLIFGVIPIVGTALCFIYLPETLGVRLPDSLEEAAQLTVKCRPCAATDIDGQTVVQVQEQGAPTPRVGASSA